MTQQPRITIEQARTLFQHAGLTPSGEDVEAVLPVFQAFYDGVSAVEEILQREDEPAVSFALGMRNPNRVSPAPVVPAAGDAPPETGPRNGGLHGLSIAESALLLQTRRVSPVELTRTYLDRAQSSDLGAFMTLMADSALAAAREAEQQMLKGGYLGPLHGIPVAVKDLIDVAGAPTTGGSPMLAQNLPAKDAACIARLRAAGAIIMGKTALHEFAYGPTGVNIHYGTPANPWDRSRVPGGSSSGSGVAIAAGLCAGALGSDTGGSIRIPAALCGIAGLKPTYGRVSRRGALPLAWSLDHVGPMARTVEDCGLLLNALAGHDPLDPASAAVDASDFNAGLRGGVTGLRIGLLRDYFLEHVDPEVVSAVEKAAEVLAAGGATVEEAIFPLARQAAVINSPIIQSEALAYHLPQLRTRPGDYSPQVRQRLLGGLGATGTMYANAQRARAVMVRRALALFDRVDLLLLPTEPVVAPTVEEASRPNGTVLSGGRADGVVNALTRFTRPFNLTGFPAISIPCGFSSGGLPIGLQLAGRPWEEATVLRAAHYYERATEWHLRTPTSLT